MNFLLKGSIAFHDNYTHSVELIQFVKKNRMKEFEDYIRNNKKKLLLKKEVDPKVWLSIENEILKKKNRKSRLFIRLVSAAAAVLLLMMIFNPSIIDTPVEDPVVANQLLTPFGIDEQKFSKLINSKTQVISNLEIPSNRKEHFDLLVKQLKFLDGQYQSYIDFIEKNGYQKFIGAQILHYYEAKIELLDKIQFEIKKIDEYENQYNSKTETTNLSL